jgi:hypothetical protein
MATTTWARTVISSTSWTVGSNRIAQVPPGGTLLRVHFGWGFFGHTSSEESVTATCANILAFGLVTTVGAGGGPPPNARSASFDAAPPSQRWVHWSSRAPRLAGITDRLMVWADSPHEEAQDTKAQVSAATVPAGQFLNLWASWAGAGAWSVTGLVEVWFWASALYSTP